MKKRRGDEKLQSYSPREIPGRKGRWDGKFRVLFAGSMKRERGSIEPLCTQTNIPPSFTTQNPRNCDPIDHQKEKQSSLGLLTNQETHQRGGGDSIWRKPCPSPCSQNAKQSGSNCIVGVEPRPNPLAPENNPMHV